MRLLEDDNLATGEEFPINAPQTKPPNANLGSTPQLTARLPPPCLWPTCHLMDTLDLFLCAKRLCLL